MNGEVKPILIFTDASWESQVGGLGTVVVDTAAGEQVTIFSGQMVDALKSRWLKEVCEHLIWQLEIYVMVNLRWSLRKSLYNRRTIWWVDYLIKGQSGSESMNQLVREYYHVDSDYPTFGWIGCRVLAILQILHRGSNRSLLRRYLVMQQSIHSCIPTSSLRGLCNPQLAEYEGGKV